MYDFDAAFRSVAAIMLNEPDPVAGVLVFMNKPTRNPNALVIGSLCKMIVCELVRRIVK